MINDDESPLHQLNWNVLKESVLFCFLPLSDAAIR